MTKGKVTIVSFDANSFLGKTVVGVDKLDSKRWIFYCSDGAQIEIEAEINYANDFKEPEPQLVCYVRVGEKQ